MAVTPVLSEPPAGALPPCLPVGVQIGRFAGRAGTTCALPGGATFFAFVLAGAFELAGQLLHTGDGLALWDTSIVELEALSNEAVVITLAWVA